MIYTFHLQFCCALCRDAVYREVRILFDQYFRLVTVVVLVFIHTNGVRENKMLSGQAIRCEERFMTIIIQIAHINNNLLKNYYFYKKINCSLVFRIGDAQQWL